MLKRYWKDLSAVMMLSTLVGLFLGCGVGASGTVQTDVQSSLLIHTDPGQLQSSLQIASSDLDIMGWVGESVNIKLSATGGNAPYSWSVIKGQLPPGLSLTSGNTISGSFSAPGQWAATIQVADEWHPHRTNREVLLFQVQASKLAMQTATLPGATMGSAYTTELVATGGTPAYQWSVVSGTLPAGLQLNSSGTLSGTPTMSGTSTFTVGVGDAGKPAQQVTKSLSLAVANTPLRITSAALQSGTNSTAYTAQLSATGGTPGYTWTVTSGALPAGVSLSASTGSITGTPTSAGSFPFTYAVSDSGLPQQRVSATATMSVLPKPTPDLGNLWFVRQDGGTRYSAVAPTGQCDGKADAAYPGNGTNQHCAFNDVRYMWLDGAYGHSQWLMAGGDTLVIRGCAALPSQENADAPHCRIGWDKSTGNDAENFWCAGVDGYCSMPPPPSGTPAQHTRILGGFAYGSYICNPVQGYPYTANNLTQLYAGFGLGTVVYLNGSKYVDMEGLELTAHNGKCARYGTTNPLPGCNRETPYSDQAEQGIITDQYSSNILLQDIYIHGFSSNGISGPIGGPFVLNNVSIDFNAFAGWNLDDGSSTPNGAGSSMTQSHVTMIGNGCQEEYPITHPQFPAKGCWDSSTGGFGDSWSGQNALLDSFTCDHCYISYNTKDAALGPHTLIKNFSVTNSYFGNNMGQQGKWGMQPNSSAYFVNNIVVGNCLRMSEQIPGAVQNFAATENTAGSGLRGFCRAAGDIFAFFSDANSSVLFANNTLIATSPTVFDLSCSIAGRCGSTPYRFINNLFLGYTEPSGRGVSNGSAPGLYYLSDSAVVVQAMHNLEFGVRNGDACGSNGNVCADPLLVNERAQGTVPPESTLDTLDVHLTTGSPAFHAGVEYTGIPTTDYYGVPQTASPTIGASVR